MDKFDSVTAQTSEWLQRHGSTIPSDYMHHLPPHLASVQIYGKNDPEKFGREVLCRNLKNLFRYLHEETNPPPNVEFVPLTKEEMNASFMLEVSYVSIESVSVFTMLQPDPNTKKKPAMAIEKKSSSMVPRNVPVPPKQPKKRRREEVEDVVDERDAASHQAFSEIRLENVLRSTIDSLLNLKFGKGRGGDFKAFNYPYNNPFALRTDRGMGVFPDDYFEKITKPCDLSKIKEHVDTSFYSTFQDFENDVHLVISNAMEYHAKNTIYFKAAVYFEKQSTAILSKAKARLTQ